MAFSPRHKQEQTAYEELWKAANPDGRDRISGDDAAAFFKKSALDYEILSRIYDLTATTHDMDLQQFFSTLRLIAIAQHNNRIESLEQLAHSLYPDVGLPKIHVLSNSDDYVPSSSIEKQAYEELWKIINPNGLEVAVKGVDAIELMKKSKLESDTLKEIWILCVPPNLLTITKQEFFNALRYISLYQNGHKKLTKELLLETSNKRIKLPELENIKFALPEDPIHALDDGISPLSSNGRFSISSIDLNSAGMRARRLSSSESITSWQDDHHRIAVNLNQIEERSAEIARSSVRVMDDTKALERVNGVRDAISADVSPFATRSTSSDTPLSQVITPLRSEVTSLRGVLNTLTDQKKSMANEILVLQARSADYAQALSRAQSQLVEKESHVLYLQSRETVLLYERDALLKEIAAVNEEINRMSECMPSMEDGVLELAVANQVSDKWKALDATENKTQAAVDKVSKEVEELRKVLESYRQESASTAKKLDEYNKEVTRVQGIITSREEAIKDLSRVLVGKDQEREKLMEQVLNERAKLPILSAAIAAARAKLFDAQENSIFEAQMSELDGEADILNDSIAAICAEVVSLQSMLNSYIEDRVEMENELARLEKEHAALAEPVEEAVCWFQAPHNNDSTEANLDEKPISAFDRQLSGAQSPGKLVRRETTVPAFQAPAPAPAPAPASAPVAAVRSSIQVDTMQGATPARSEADAHRRVSVGKLTEEDLHVGRNDINYAYHSEGDNYRVNVNKMVETIEQRVNSPRGSLSPMNLDSKIPRPIGRQSFGRGTSEDAVGRSVNSQQSSQ